VQTTAATLLRKVAGPLLVQTLVWAGLTVAFAALLRLAGPQSWPNALHFAALNWMPWVVLAPAVFWFSNRFPLERGHLWSSIPAHVVGCVLCVTITVWVATYVGYWTRPPRLEERRQFIDRESRDRAAPDRSVADRAAERSADAVLPDRAAADRPAVDQPAPDRPAAGTSRPKPSYPTPTFDRPSRGERFGRGENRPPFARRRPFWWPFLGTALLRANFDAAVYLIVVVAAHALAFYRRAQERERQSIALAAGLNRAKLDALRLQLQPHFLFNTLNAISTLVHRDATAADELIGDLSELLRVSLQTSEHEVPLDRELELLDRYLAIEQARLGDRLKVIREIDPAALRGYVPTFVLQPIVENAIRHGIEPRVAPGSVIVRARRAGNRLHLSVIDDGVGLGVSGTRAARRGIGISNTEARLRALHGDAATLEITAPATGGVAVEITVPYSSTAQPERASGADEPSVHAEVSRGTPRAVPPGAAASGTTQNAPL
jgi:hypothetical protein